MKIEEGSRYCPNGWRWHKCQAVLDAKELRVVVVVCTCQAFLAQKFGDPLKFSDPRGTTPCA